ncbi:carboxylesterase NlhH [Apiospora saccharicola]|uniref:Carboxylesterase NlhH n=1 Tax=Apiospora saccharicola TaxID=335842 RepID=A0ABR1WD66_9PEZI
MDRPPYVDPDYWRLLGGQVPEPKSPTTDLTTIRNNTNAATKAASDALPFPDGMITTVSTATSDDGTPFNITRFLPLEVQRSKDPAPSEPSFTPLEAGLWPTATQVFAPDYRLAPEHPYPAAFQDVYTTVTWLQAHAGEFNVDPARVVAFGQSAGGNLVTAAALQARDKGLTPPIAALVLRYPMLDDRTRMDPENPRLSYLTWSPGSNAAVWKAYLAGVQEGSPADAVPPYTAVPGRADDLHGLPPTHSTSFAARLSSHDVKVQSNVYPGVPHGFDGSPAFSLRFELWGNEAKFIQQF